MERIEPCPWNARLNSLRVLIDTNIFISRENAHLVPPDLQNLLVKMNELGAKLLIHPRSTEDLRRDQNQERRDVIMSKIGSYSFLEAPLDPRYDTDFLQRIGNPSNPNDEVDAAILYAVYRDAVDYLITEDKDIQKKSERVDLRKRVLSITEALNIFSEASMRHGLRHPPALSVVPVYHLKLSDHFFDQLKGEYPEFEDWFKKISREGRSGFAYLNEDDSLGALMILKIEDGEVSCDPPLTSKKRMKVATLQVEHVGFKIGELYVKLAVHEAIANNCEELYMTHFVKENDRLVELVHEFGFEPVAKNKRGEVIFVKALRPQSNQGSNLNPLEISQRFYPSFSDRRAVKKFLVPIRPDFHERLFVDYPTRQTKLPEYRGEFIVEGNTIKKAYLCNSNNRSIAKGDLMLFYRSEDRKEVTALGVVESARLYQRHVEDVARIVEKRTVYSIKEMTDMLRQPTTVLLFNWHFYLPHPVTLEELHAMGISAPQTLTRLSETEYLEIRRRGGIDERFAVN